MTTLTLQDTNDEGPESSALSDTDSIHSCSDVSETSTLMYDQESYQLFQVRVHKLCRMLWPPSPGASEDAPLTERLRGGDDHRVVGIRLPASEKEQDRNRGLILRVPRWGQGQIERAVATLDYVRRNSSIPVAAVVAKDYTNENPLDSPYLLQRRLPGYDLEVLWPDLNHAQRCAIAREMGRVIKSLLALESPVSGFIQASAEDTETIDRFTIVPFNLKPDDGNPLQGLEHQTTHVMGAPDERQTTLDFFKLQIGHWRAVDVARNAPLVHQIIGLWDAMLEIAEQMDDLGLFPTTFHCLCHVDLHPRNVMAEIGSDGSVHVTGILDWDEAVIAPKFVCCEPPGWLWGFDTDEIKCDDRVTWPYEMSGANDVPPTAEKQELKRIFEEHAGSEYRSLAYDEHFRLSRTLFRVAVFGLTSGENFSAADRIVSDWDRLRRGLARGT